MTKQGFEEMKMLEKVQTVLEYGEEIMTRTYMYYTIKLYAVTNFFVEIWYRQYASKIDNVKTVDISEVFLNYKDHIDISDLYQKN